MAESKPPVKVSKKLDFSKLPDQTVTIIVKNQGKVHTTGLTLPVIAPDTPDEDLVMAMQRVKDCNTRLLNTIYYTLAKKPKEQELPELS